MNEIARNYDDDLTKRSLDNQKKSHMNTPKKDEKKKDEKKKK